EFLTRSGASRKIFNSPRPRAADTFPTWSCNQTCKASTTVDFAPVFGARLDGLDLSLDLVELPNAPQHLNDCTNSFKAFKRPGWVSIAGLLPPPRQRTRLPSCSAPARRSARPRQMVLHAIPVAGETTATTPCPATRASLAANRRLSFSSRISESALKRAMTAAVSII